MTQLSKINETPAQPKKKILKESAMPIIVKPTSLRDLFNQLDEAIAPGQKPLPVLDPQNKSAGVGFVTSKNPAVQNMLKNLDPKDVQIVQTANQTSPGQTTTAAGQPNPNQIVPTAGGNGQAMHEEELDEISQDTLKSYATKADVDLVSTNRKLKDRYHTGLDPALMRQSNNRRQGIKLAGDKAMGRAKISANEGDLPSSSGVDTRGTGLGAGRPATTFESKDIKDHKFEVCYTTTSDKEVKITITALNIKEATAKIEKKHNFKSLDSVKKVKEEKKEVKEGHRSGFGPAKGKKPDFLDTDKDGDKKEPMKKAVADKKKKTVKESMSHKMMAARLEGKAHGLKGHAYNGKQYDDIEEARCYLEGYKEGLDECHGQPAELGIASDLEVPTSALGSIEPHPMPAMETEFDEGNAFTKALAGTSRGDKFRVAGKTFDDYSTLDEYTFESLDNQLNALLNEGISVSISKGQENAPNSVTITAQDQEADELLALVRNAGMGGIFGNDENSENSFAMPNPPEIGGASEINTPGEIEVVDDHEGMLALMKKLAGNQPTPVVQVVSDEEEVSDNQDDMLSLMNKVSGEETVDCESEECPQCYSSDCECANDEPQVDEEETEDQLEFEVAEDSNSDMSDQPTSDNPMSSADTGQDIEDEDAELTEWANEAGGHGTETTFEQDIDFMTNVISGGLNKKKATGQTTIPVVNGQNDRMGYSDINESISDWTKLAGISKY